MDDVTKVSREGPFGCIRIAHPPVNAISQRVRQGLAEAFEELSRDDAVSAIVLTGENDRFPSGADLREFGKPPVPPSLNDVFAVMDRCGKPIVAVIGTAALGGGFELALACDLRICTESAVVGLPEVKLGIIPGAGGTQRLLRLVDGVEALTLVTRGAPVDARTALKLGLVDHVVGEPALENAMRLLQASAVEKRRLSDRPAIVTDAERFEQAAATAISNARGVDAVGVAVEVIRNGLDADFASGLKMERERFLTLRDSRQAAAMRYLFFAERKAPKVEGLRADPVPIASVGVIGAGMMGTGIAVALANAGYEVAITDHDPASLERGLAAIDAIYAASSRAGSAEEARERRARIAGEAALAEIATRDLCIEAAFEDLEIKRNIFSELGRMAPAHTILASNTSFLDVDRIAEASGRGEKVLGLHFFSPAHIMPLLEIVRGDETSDTTLATALALARRLRKVAVVSGVCDGFIGNRISQVFRKQCEFMLEEGALPEEVDRALTGFGFRMGPFAVADMAGLDLSWARRKRLAVSRDPKERYAEAADLLCEMGRFGQKTGAGWYLYDDGSRNGRPDPVVRALLEERSAAKGYRRRRFTSDEIVGRALFAMINEALLVLEDKVAQRASDIDVVMVNGFGFPRTEGGPLFWASRFSDPEIEAGLDAVAAATGHGFRRAREPGGILRSLEDGPGQERRA